MAPPRNVPGESVERQITVSPVISAAVPARLAAVNQMSPRIPIHHHFGGPARQTTHARAQQRGLDLQGIVRQFVAATVAVAGQLQPVEGCRPRQGDAAVMRKKPIRSQRIHLVAGRRQQRVQPQTLMIMEIFIAPRQPVDSLRHPLLDRVIDEALVPDILKTPGQRSGHPPLLIGRAQQEYAAVAGERAAGKIGDHLTRTQVLKEQRLVLTACRRRSGEWCFHLAE